MCYRYIVVEPTIYMKKKPWMWFFRGGKFVLLKLVYVWPLWDIFRRDAPLKKDLATILDWYNKICSWVYIGLKARGMCFFTCGWITNERIWRRVKNKLVLSTNQQGIEPTISHFLKKFIKLNDLINQCIWIHVSPVWDNVNG